MESILIKNNQTLPLRDIPVLDYVNFLEQNTALLVNDDIHCVLYFGFLKGNSLQLVCCMADDRTKSIHLSSCLIGLFKGERERAELYPSFSRRHPAFQVFEREIHENFGLNYSDHPWLKPVRFPFDRADKNSKIENYPFYEIDSEELHEVGVGPIHAGIIEPGHFRFICNGEQILHLETQHGFQHRGIEALFLKKVKLPERTTLAESIAGDSVAGHTTAFVNLWESLCGYQPDGELQFSRTLTLELERIAIHTGDLSAICTDIAYQLGSAVFGRLRTPIINYFQSWCGNRMAKGLIRAGNTHYPFTKESGAELVHLFDEFEPDFNRMYTELKNLPSALSRLEKTGEISREQALTIGTVGISARMTGLQRDIRLTHPHDLYDRLGHVPLMKNHGDVYSRTQLRKEEILQSIGYIRDLLIHLFFHWLKGGGARFAIARLRTGKEICNTIR
jgi:Ni,Fe-hydrogenase III large subunit